DDASGELYFSEESVGIWRVAAEPEADAARTPVDLIEPRGALHEEVKGLAIYREAGQGPYLVAAGAGGGALKVYELTGGRVGTFQLGGSKELEVGDVEGVTIGAGSLIVADEDAGNYKVVAWSDVAAALALPKAADAPPSAASKAARTVEPRVE